MKKIPVIIDTDPGIDDLMALMVAAASDKLDIRAITTVSGNVSLETTTQNALDISDIFNIDAPVAKGASKPLLEEKEFAEHVHGANGLGNVALPKSNKTVHKDYAWDLIYQEAKKNPNELVLIPIGPLTNIATAILKYPDLKDYVKEIVFMGGSATDGNVTPYAEFNIYVDPIAADIVFKSGIKTTMVGLNVTMNSKITKQEAQEIADCSSKYNSELKQLMGKIFDFYETIGLDTIAIHDALTVSYVIDKSLLTCEKYYTTVETISPLTVGKTIVDLENSHRDKEKNMYVAIDSDPAKFRVMLKEAASKF